jgi:hypothetical protein
MAELECGEIYEVANTIFSVPTDLRLKIENIVGEPQDVFEEWQNKEKLSWYLE